ncbi:trypsin-like peptidase domain-containing protein [Gaopeijia maritima]|uniref:Trypsin-like peptidase domain-containing protein n=1 Tax=Gaopeijia maritima TaxID=3119007 RepID=A0ABU9EBB0_9BACT
MTLELRVLTGGRAGEVRRFTEDTVLVGRAEGAHLRLDPVHDLHVSAQHARLVRRADDWWVVDLGSRNGTWLNGQRVEEPVPLRPGMRVRLGWEGPELEILGPGGSRGDDLGRLARRNRLLLGGLALLMVALVTVVGMNLRARNSARSAWMQERAALVARTDSLMQLSSDMRDRLEGEVAGLADALDASRVQAAQLQADLARLGDEAGDPEELARLEERLRTATAALETQQIAASLDAASLTARVRPAVALIYVEFEDGERSVATGFAISTDGRVVTNRHVVAGPAGTNRAVRLGVQFSGSPQVWPAELVRTDEASDLALLDVRNLLGGNPAVPGINTRADTLAAGSPVLLLGFPFASPTGESEDGLLPRALSTAGVIRGRAAGRLEIQGWGAEGASGSPVFDGTGQVAGVLFGASGVDDERYLVAVPASALLAFIAGDD